MSSDRPSTPPAAGGGGAPAGGNNQNCPCPTDFIVRAPCRIVKTNGGRIVLTAEEMPTCPTAGTYAWTTTSTKVSLGGANSSTCNVDGLANAGTGRDSETITVTRTGPGCTPIVKTVQVTVAKVVFSDSPNRRYGYDDMDTAADPTDDHINIKKLDYTFVKVDITGGALSTDFDWVCDPAGICTVVAPAAGASFDLRLNGEDHDTALTTLQCKSKCPGNPLFASLQVHVYKEKFVEVVVAKFYDSTAAGTTLNFPTADYAAQTATYNGKIREGVARYEVTNFDAANACTDVRFDLDGNGAFSFDINAGGGAEFNALAAAFTGTGTKRRVMIVRNMKSYYYLSAAAAIGATALAVTAADVFSYPPTLGIPIGLGADQETVNISAVAPNSITLSTPLTKAHAIGAPIEYPAVGWSTDPILVAESSSVFDVLKWTVCHEVGHRDLLLADVDVDTTTIMYYSRGRTDYRLRMAPRTKKHLAGGTEIQWETIPRT